MNVSSSTISGGVITSGIIATIPQITGPLVTSQDTSYSTSGHKYGVASGEYSASGQAGSYSSPYNTASNTPAKYGNYVSGSTPGSLYREPTRNLNNPWGDLQAGNV